MKDSLDRYRVEKIGAGALLPTPDNLKELAVGFVHSGGWLRKNKPVERIEVDPKGEVCVRVNYRNALTGNFSYRSVRRRDKEVNHVEGTEAGKQFSQFPEKG